MKRFLNMMAVCCTVVVIGCASTTTSPTATTISPGAVGPCGPDCTKACCTKDKGDASLGEIGQDSGCPYSKNADGNTNLGVIGDQSKSSGPPACCKAKKGNADASLGALGPASCSKKNASSSGALPPCCKSKAGNGSN